MAKPLQGICHHCLRRDRLERIKVRNADVYLCPPCVTELERWLEEAPPDHPQNRRETD